MILCNFFFLSCQEETIPKLLLQKPLAMCCSSALAPEKVMLPLRSLINFQTVVIIGTDTVICLHWSSIHPFSITTYPSKGHRAGAAYPSWHFGLFHRHFWPNHTALIFFSITSSTAPKVHWPALKWTTSEAEPKRPQLTRGDPHSPPQKGLCCDAQLMTGKKNTFLNICLILPFRRVRFEL